VYMRLRLFARRAAPLAERKWLLCLCSSLDWLDSDSTCMVFVDGGPTGD